MLALPARGFNRSVNIHNVELGACCDWLEASVLFADDDLGGADIVDILRENEIYSEQSFAWELVNDAFSVIQKRGRIIGEGYPVGLRGPTRLGKRDSWELYPAYAFCLVLSLPTSYPAWTRMFGPNFTEQGELFEALTAESIQASLTGWAVYRTGWTRSAPSRLSSVVGEVASLLGEATGDLVRWSRRKANEAGLDLVCFRPFPDGRVGVPTYLFQCASGNDWRKKMKQPDLDIWTKIITFASHPKKAFSIPFALSDEEYLYGCAVVNGLLLDRHRLLAPGRITRNWLSADLASRLIAWARPRIVQLPYLERA